MSTETIVRRAQPQDAPGVARVQVDCWHAAYADILGAEILKDMNVTNRTARWQSILNESASQTWVALRNERQVAFISFGMAREPAADAGKTGEVWALYAHPDVWGQGVGRRLWLAGLDALREAGCETAVIWVLEKNRRGRTFYESTGCILDGQKKSNPSLGAGVVSLCYRIDIAHSPE